MGDKLFEDEWGIDNSAPDETEIKQLILYYSAEEKKEFKKLCKEGMRATMGIEKAKQEGNISDYILQLLRNANIKTQAIPN